MNPVLRTGIAIAALAFPAVVLAADPPSASGIDLGAVKLKKAVTPGQAAPPAGGAAATPVAPTTALPAVQRQPSTAPLVKQPLTLPQATQQQAATPQPAAQQAVPKPPSNIAANQTGVGTVVGTAPIGRKSASDILGQGPGTQAQQTSNDVQVKMPTMFKKVNPTQ